MDDERIGSLRATAHPLRLQMLSLLTGAELSAAEVARELGITHANASYHLRTLYDAGKIVVTGEERIRGGVAKRYRYVLEEQRPGRETADPASRSAWAEALGLEVQRRIATLDPSRPQLQSDIETWVSPEVWREARELLARASRLLHDRAQPARTPGTWHVSASDSAFVMSDAHPTQDDA